MTFNRRSDDELMSLDVDREGCGPTHIIQGAAVKAKTELVSRRLLPEALYDKDRRQRFDARPVTGGSTGRATTAHTSNGGQKNDRRQCLFGRTMGANERSCNILRAPDATPRGRIPGAALGDSPERPAGGERR